MTVQRYSAYNSGDPHKIGMWADNEGEWILLSDHERAIEEAIAAERDKPAPEFPCDEHHGPIALSCNHYWSGYVDAVRDASKVVQEMSGPAGSGSTTKQVLRQDAIERLEELEANL